jgi:predicted transcriptional regulator
MIIDKKIIETLMLIKNNNHNYGYGRLLNKTYSGVNSVKVIKNLYDKNLISIKREGTKKIVFLTEKGEKLFLLLLEIKELIK